MTSNAIAHIEDNISTTWAKTIIRLHEGSGKEERNALLRVNSFTDGIANEKPEIRNLIDEWLRKNGEQDCHTVANTIFPRSLWNRNRYRHELYDRYRTIYPLIRRAAPRLNSHGVYFERLIDYGHDGEDRVNQLEHVIQTYSEKGNSRRSALQCAIFDPHTDHCHSRQKGFPCMQQIGFSIAQQSHLSVIGFYPLQYAVRKTYGNLLGLCRLGEFMAHALGLELSEVCCFAATETLGQVAKRDIAGLVKSLQKVIGEDSQNDT